MAASDFSEVSPSAADFQLAEELTAAARELHRAGTPQDTLHTVVRFAVRIVPGADHAGVSVLERGRTRRGVAWSDETARSADTAADDLAYGSYWSDLWTSPVATLADTDEVEGGADGGLAKIGLRSVLSLRLSSERRKLTVLTLYGREPDAHGEVSVRIGRMLTAHASLALESATVQEQLTEAMRTRDLIGQATGLLMARLEIDAGDAFARLVGTSQRENIKLREIAQRVIDTARERPEEE